MPSDDPYKHHNSGVSGLLESGLAQMAYGALRRIFGIRIIAANQRGGTFDDEFCTGALSRYRGDGTIPAAPTDDVFPEPCTIAEPLFVRTRWHSER
jgi:hypothetical protein